MGTRQRTRHPVLLRHHAPEVPGFADDVPYNYAVVELEEGPRIISNIVGVPGDEIVVDMPLQALFDDVSPDTTLIRFTRRAP